MLYARVLNGPLSAPISPAPAPLQEGTHFKCKNGKCYGLNEFTASVDETVKQLQIKANEFASKYGFAKISETGFVDQKTVNLVSAIVVGELSEHPNLNTDILTNVLVAPTIQDIEMYAPILLWAFSPQSATARPQQFNINVGVISQKIPPATQEEQDALARAIREAQAGGSAGTGPGVNTGAGTGPGVNTGAGPGINTGTGPYTYGGGTDNSKKWFLISGAAAVGVIGLFMLLKK